MSVPEERSDRQSQTGQEAGSRAEQRVQEYMLRDEEVSYDLRFRPTGLVNWVKSLFGYGVTHWFVTNQRLIRETRVGGGFLSRTSHTTRSVRSSTARSCRSPWSLSASCCR